MSALCFKMCSMRSTLAECSFSTYRDLTKELEGLDRFIPVRSDDKIMTCFLEYESAESVAVHDLIYTRVGGLTTGEIARAFVVPERTIAQRIVRAKRTLTESHVPFEVPRGAELAARLSSVLEVIYLIFNEGYSATSGDDWIRPALCEDALRLGRILAECVPKEPEVHGLVALMEIQASRSRARVGPTGEPILLLDQNRAQWDQLLIRRGLAALERAEQLSGARAHTRCSRDRCLSRAGPFP